MLFDSHVHLNDDKIYSKLEEVINDANNNDVSYMLCVGYDLASSKRALEIAEKYPHVFAAIGFHPTEALNVKDEDYIWLENQLTNPKVKAIGEIGLDYYWDATYKETQKKVFIKQIELADKYHLPISIHMRDALEDTLEIIQHVKPQSVNGVMHCYGGSVESAKLFIQSNMLISLGGPVTFKNARVPKAVAKEIDLKYLLIETDAPYLAPHPNRGKENTPAYIHFVAKEIASIKELSYEQVAFQTTENAKLLFNIKE